MFRAAHLGEETSSESLGSTTYLDEVGDDISRYAAMATTFIEQPCVHGRHVEDIAGCKQLLRDLVRLDRLPRFSTIEGLLLLRQAWDEYDVKMWLASKNKMLCKASFIFLLVP